MAEVYVWLLSKIGVRVDRPALAAAEVTMERGSLEDVKPQILDVMERELSEIGSFIQRLIEGEVPTY